MEQDCSDGDSDTDLRPGDIYDPFAFDCVNDDDLYRSLNETEASQSAAAASSQPTVATTSHQPAASSQSTSTSQKSTASSQSTVTSKQPEAFSQSTVTHQQPVTSSQPTVATTSHQPAASSQSTATSQKSTASSQSTVTSQQPDAFSQSTAQPVVSSQSTSTPQQSAASIQLGTYSQSAVSNPTNLSQRDHRKKLYKGKGVYKQKVYKKTYAYLGPRLQFPPAPAKPAVWIAEGAETMTQKRLICSGQVVQISGIDYVVVMVYWCGSKSHGKNRFSPRSPFQALLIRLPLPIPLPSAKVKTLTYHRAMIDDILDSESPDPVILPTVCQETVELMGHHSRELLQVWGNHNQWWERPLLVLTKAGQQVEKLRQTALKKKKGIKSQKPKAKRYENSDATTGPPTH